MANRRSGGYYNPYGYGGRGNPYSGQGIITRRSPFSKPFVDYGKHFSAGVAKWMPIHLAYIDQMEKDISEGKTKYAEAMATFQERAITTDQPINEEQAEGGEVTVTEDDGSGNETTTTKTILGEDEDLKQFVEQYAEKYRIANNIRGKYYKRGKKKGQFKKYVGFGGGASVTEEGVAARTDLKRIERAIENAKADKVNYMSMQNEFFHDDQTLNIIGAQTNNAKYHRFMKFIDRDNLTRYDQKTGEMFIIAKDCKAPPCEISVTELAKLKPQSANYTKIETFKQNLKTITSAENIGNVTELTPVGTGKWGNFDYVKNFTNTDTGYGVPKAEFAEEGKYYLNVEDGIGYQFKNGKYVVVETGVTENTEDKRLVHYGNVMNDINFHMRDWNYDDVLNGIHNDTTLSPDGSTSISPYSSNEFRALDLIYKVQASLDYDDEGSANYNLLRDRAEKYDTMPMGIMEKFTNDRNFVLNKDMFTKDSDARKGLIAGLDEMKKDGFISDAEYKNALDYVDGMANYVNGHHIHKFQGKNQTISTIATDAYKRYHVNTIKGGLEGNLKSSQMLTHDQQMDLDESARKWKELSLKERQFEHKKKMDDIASGENDFTLIDHIDEVFSYKIGNNPEKIKNDDLMLHFTGLPIMSSDNKKVGEMNLLVAKPSLEFLKKGDVLTIEYKPWVEQTTVGKSKTIKQEKSELREPSYIIFNGDLETLKSELNKRLYESSPAFTKSSFTESAETARILKEINERNKKPPGGTIPGKR